MSAARAAKRRAARNGGRPDRSVPAASVIVRYWAERESSSKQPAPWDSYGWDWFEPACMACGMAAPGELSDPPRWTDWNRTEGWLNRCHVIPRVRNGLDGPQNLVLMCEPCHQAQPQTDDPEDTWRYMRERTLLDRLVQSGYLAIRDGELALTEKAHTAIEWSAS